MYAYYSNIEFHSIANSTALYVSSDAYSLPQIDRYRKQRKISQTKVNAINSKPIINAYNAFAKARNRMLSLIVCMCVACE